MIVICSQSGDNMKNSKLVEFFLEIGMLKKIKRSGWLRKKIPNPESVADHSFRTAIIAMIMGETLNIDVFKLVKMALIHDLAEVQSGDITPYDGIKKEKKRILEEKALRQMLDGISSRQDLLDLWLEYEEQKSKEAKILKNIDRLEMAISALEYQKNYPQKDLSEFILEAERQIDIPEIAELLEEFKN